MKNLIKIAAKDKKFTIIFTGAAAIRSIYFMLDNLTTHVFIV